MEFYEPEEEIEQNNQISYNLPLFEHEYELSINLNESFLEFKLKQKNIISNYYYIKELDLQTINELFFTNLGEIKESFFFFNKLLKDRNAKLLYNVDKTIITNFKYLLF